MFLADVLVDRLRLALGLRHPAFLGDAPQHVLSHPEEPSHDGHNADSHLYENQALYASRSW